MDTNRSDPSPGQALGILLAIVAISMIWAFISGVVVVYGIYQTRAKQRFDRAVWLGQAEAFAASETRAAMADDLMENHLKPGMRKDEIVKMLGAPSSTGGCRNQTLRLPLGQDHCVGYAIGENRSDTSRLELAFDKSGRFLKAGMAW